MANTIQLKRSSVAGHTPTLAAGELAINDADQLLFWKDSGGTLRSTHLREGSGNGFDADKLDGQEGSYYRDAGNINAGTLALARLAVAAASDWRANTASKLLQTDNVWSAADLVALTYAATIAVDLSAFINATVTLTGNGALGAPSATKVGQCGFIYIVQDGTGSRTLSYNAVWKFAGGTAPTLSTAANAVDRLFYFVRSSTFIEAQLTKDIK
jgi:hypothetical protein